MSHVITGSVRKRARKKRENKENPPDKAIREDSYGLAQVLCYLSTEVSLSSLILVVSVSTCQSRRAKGQGRIQHTVGSREGRADVGLTTSRFLHLLFIRKMAGHGCREVSLRSVCG